MAGPGTSQLIDELQNDILADLQIIEGSGRRWNFTFGPATVRTHVACPTFALFFASLFDPNETRLLARPNAGTVCVVSAFL
jgi:hypothetical protein